MAGQKTESRFGEALPMTKYRDWYCQIIEVARNRVIPTCYTEVHHIHPRALGGGDEPANLVRLTYREHFLVHWLLTKFCTGRDRRAMQHAMNAMTMPVSGGRIIAGWQFDAVKRALKDLQDDPEVHEAFMARYYRDKQEREGAVMARAIDERLAREAERLRIEREIAEPSKISKRDVEDLANRILRFRSGKKFRVDRVKGPSEQPSRKRSGAKTRESKAARRAARENLERLGLRLNA